MPIYETVFMARQDLSETQVKDMTEKFVKIINDQGGKVLKIEQWGLRTLAYKINKAKKAHYTLIESDAPGAAVIELERVMRIEEDVLRALTLKLDEPSKAQSAILDKSRDRDFDTNTDKEAA
jgi:small subunit ribosomal protein S6